MTRASDTARLLSGGAVINEDSNDVDFRVESNGNTHALFVDGGNDGVGIGTSSVDTNATMTISNTGDNHALSIVGALNKSRMHFQGANTGSGSTDGLVIGLSSSDDTNDDSALIGLKENGSMSFQTNNANRMRIDANGRMQIHSDGQGTFTSDASLEVRGQQNPLIIVSQTQNGDEVAMRIRHDFARSSQTATMIQFFNNANEERGSIKTGASSTAYNTSSDYRLKEAVTSDWDATTRLKQLNPVRFNFIAEPNTTVDGFLAHEVQSVVPQAITGEKDATETYTDDDGKEQTRIKPQAIDQSKLVPLLVKTIQELEARITTLESK